MRNRGQIRRGAVEAFRALRQVGDRLRILGIGASGWLRERIRSLPRWWSRLREAFRPLARSGLALIRWWPRLLAVGLALLLVAMLWLYASIRRAAALQPTRHADVIIVLGAGSYGGWPAPVYRARLDHALQLFRSLQMCRDLGISAQGAATISSPLERDTRSRFKRTLRECGKYFIYRLAGR